MGDNKDLSGMAAVSKLKELAEDKICLFCTYENNKVVSRPMSTAGVDEDGTIWFLSDKESEKNRQLEKDNQVYLMYMDNSSNHYLSLSGQSSIVEDKVKLEALWTPIAKAWFEEGVDDPRISLIKVKPKTGHYWDTKNGKLVSMLKIAAAVVTGKEGMDDGIEGDLKIK